MTFPKILLVNFLAIFVFSVVYAEQIRPEPTAVDCKEFASTASEIHSVRLKNKLSLDEFNNNVLENTKNANYIKSESVELKKEIVRWAFKNFDEHYSSSEVYKIVLLLCNNNIEAQKSIIKIES